MYIIQTRKLPSVLESRPESVVAVLGVRKIEFLIRAVVELDEQGLEVKSRRNPNTSVFLSTKKKDAVFAAIIFWLSDIGHININISRIRDSIVIKLS